MTQLQVAERTAQALTARVRARGFKTSRWTSGGITASAYARQTEATATAIIGRKGTS